MSTPDPGPALFGFLAVDKPAGPTSHDVVEAARKALGLKRIGHAGTLDPFAEGVLLLLIGPAVRCLAHLPDWPKTYEASARLGATTDTDDATGKELARKPVGDVTEDRVRQALAAFVGVKEQVPPHYAAVKVGGERAYAPPFRTASRNSIARLRFSRKSSSRMMIEISGSTSR